MGPARQARVREVRQRWRRRSDEYEEPIQFPTGYSRNGVFGPTRGMEGHGQFPEMLAPSAMEVDGSSTCGTEATVAAAAAAVVYVKLEQSVDSAESRTLRVDNFRRPFTLNAVKAFVQQCGPMENGGFWMDAIKTHCYVTFSSVNVARDTKAAIHGIVWPAESGQPLSVSFSTTTAMEVIAGGPSPHTPRHQLKLSSTKREASNGTIPRTRVIRGRGAPAPISSRFLKTKAKPMLYYLPVSESEVRYRKRKRMEREHGLSDSTVKG